MVHIEFDMPLGLVFVIVGIIALSLGIFVGSRYHDDNYPPTKLTIKEKYE
jgi:hypothetical protein